MYVLGEDGANVAYYELTIAEGVASAQKPTVTITFNVGTDGKEVASMKVNARVAVKLPVAESTDGNKVLVGWYLDADCSDDNKVAAYYIPTKDIKLYAKFGDEVVVTIIDAQNPAESTSSIASGTALSTAIPEANTYVANQLSEDGKYYFTGWYVDANGNGIIDEGEDKADPEALASSFSSAELTIIAQWTAVPEYVGTYYGAEVYSKNSISSKYGLTIDHIGNIKYFEVDYSTKQPKNIHEGNVTGYDAANGVLTWTQTKYNGNASSQGFTVYFDAASKVFMGFYDNKSIGTDFLFFSQSIQVGNAPTAVYAIKVPGTSSQGYYARIILAPTALGEDTIVYSINNKIYSGASITDGLGESLSVADKGEGSIGASSTIIIRDSAGNILLARGNQSGKTFADGKDTVELGAEFGEYVAGEGTLVLDGAGGALYTIGGSAKKVTYSAIDGGYEFYVFVDGVKTEYYTFTLQDSTAAVVMPTVQITFVTEYGTQQAIDANVNIAIQLPVLTDETHVFRGWKISGTDSALGTMYVVTEAKELTAIWLEKVTITIVYNDGATENVQKEYGKGETVNVAEPVWEKHAFDGWFTSETFEDGTEWTSGSAITANVTICAKWSDAPIYNAKYTPLEVEGTKADGEKEKSAYARTYAVLDVNTKGLATGTAYPYSGTVKISNYDATIGTVTFEFNNEKYAAFMNAAGLIVVSRSTAGDLAEVNVLAMNYDSTSDSVKYSYWNSGKTRCVVYTGNGGSTNIFIYQNKVYFGVSFTDTLGNAIAAISCFESPELLVKDASGELIAKFGFDGTTMAVMDGYEGTYSNGSESITLNGIKTITIGENSGTYTKAAEGSDYTFEAYMTEDGKTVHYQLTVDKAAHTYTIVKPEVTFTYISAYGEVASSVQVNTGVEYTLPAGLTSQTHTFLGWYVTGDETQTIVTKVTSPSEATSFTAKWADKVVLTIVYGNGLENRTVDLYVGAALNMDDYKISWANKHLFEGWYAGSDFATAFTATTIESDINVYAKWSEEECDLYTLVNEKKSGLILAWNQDGTTYTSANKGINSSYSRMTITANAKITISFKYTVSSEAKWDKLLVKVGNSEKLNKSGVENGSFELTVEAGSSVTIEYSKDNSGNSNDDKVTLTDFTITAA